MRGGSGPDLRKPEWARPLAPLPEWLDAVDQILRRSQAPTSVRQSYYLAPLEVRADRMSAFRREYGLTQSEAAEILGHADAAVIQRIEEGLPVRPDQKRQQALAERLWAAPIRSRGIWLKDWRKRLGITQATASNLRACCRFEVSDCERGWSPLTWERILRAIFIERETNSGRNS